MPDNESDQYGHILKEFSERLAAIRKKAGLTQAQVGKLAGMQQSHVTLLESGQSNVSLRTLAKVADVLGVGPRDLLPVGKVLEFSPDVLQRLREFVAKQQGVMAERRKQDELAAAELAEVARTLDALTGEGQQPGKEAEAPRPAKPKPRTSH